MRSAFSLHCVARTMTGLGVMFVLASLLSATAAVADTDRRPLLAAPYGELCTTCDGYLLCEPTARSAGQAQLLQVHKHTFWGQIGTIWSWLRHLFRPVRPDTRNLTIHRLGDDGQWTIAGTARVTLDLGSLRIDYPSGWIDRKDGGWHDTRDQRIGICRAVKADVLTGASP